MARDVGVDACFGELSDDEDAVDVGIAAALATGCHQNLQRHCARMTQVRQQRQLVQPVKRSIHKKTTLYNDKTAVHRRDVIPDTVEAGAIQRKCAPGRQRKWLAQSMLRVCFRERAAPAEQANLSTSLRSQRRRARKQRAKNTQTEASRVHGPAEPTQASSTVNQVVRTVAAQINPL